MRIYFYFSRYFIKALYIKFRYKEGCGKGNWEGILIQMWQMFKEDFRWYIHVPLRWIGVKGYLWQL